MRSEIIPSVDINALMPPHPGQIKLPQKMRRHRTASESSENENENENEFNSQQRRRENE